MITGPPPRFHETRDILLPAGQQALLVLAHLNKGETYTALAGGFGVGTTTVFRYVREGVDVLAAVAPTLDEALDLVRRKAFVVLDGTLLSIDRVGMVSGYDRGFFSGKHKRHGVNVQVIADPAGRLVWADESAPMRRGRFPWGRAGCTGALMAFPGPEDHGPWTGTVPAG